MKRSLFSSTDTSKELRIFYKRMFSSNYFSSSSFDFNETRIVLINCYVPIIIKFDTTFYICNNTMTAPKRPAPKRPALKCPRAQTAAPKRRRPNGGAQKSRTPADIVRPLTPCTVSGNRFILTVVDFASHFPPAFPIKTHTAAEVVRCLISVFRTFGFPDQILSDCGSEFMSELMQLFLLECKVAQFKRSPYHPQSNGCLVRFHRTLKSMLKGVGETFPGDWDQLLPWVLFAYREVPVEGLMFSPFDLVFGRNVKGVLQLIKKFWLKENRPEEVRSQNVNDYVLQLRERIRSSLEVVNANEEIVKKRFKFWYDRNTKPVSYKEGALVLVLLPLIGKPLQAKFFGLYVDEKRIGEIDYVVRSPDRRKSRRVVHVNLLEKYISRVTDTPSPIAIVTVAGQVLRDGQFFSVSLDHLVLVQRGQLSSLLVQFKDVFDDKPGRTTVVEHTIKLVPGARPVRQTPYRLHPEKQRAVNTEIASLLEQGFIEETNSPWAVPILVVPKPDGTDRLCVDYHKLNNLTEPDPFPIPRIDALLDRLGGATIMTKLDMTPGYWQVPIASSDVGLTGVVTSHGHYHLRFMPLGLRNAIATFRRLVTKVPKGLKGFYEAYLDDVMVFSRSWEAHIS